MAVLVAGPYDVSWYSLSGARKGFEKVMTMNVLQRLQGILNRVRSGRDKPKPLYPEHSQARKSVKAKKHQAPFLDQKQ